jgi:LysR family transcriptional activator of nhaA
MDGWLETNELRPVLAGEFDDTALMMAFGSRGLGVFPAPRVLEDEIKAQFGVHVVGRVDDIRQGFFAITVERRLRHPAVVAVVETARDALFSPAG